MNLLKRIRRLFGPTTEEMFLEFRAKFPNRCMVCSFWEYSRRECFTTDPTPPHKCLKHQTDSEPSSATTAKRGLS
jgi:hypothetical protein